jgi:hypothetical protein
MLFYRVRFTLADGGKVYVRVYSYDSADARREARGFLPVGIPYVEKIHVTPLKAYTKGQRKSA